MIFFVQLINHTFLNSQNCQIQNQQDVTLFIFNELKYTLVYTSISHFDQGSEESASRRFVKAENYSRETNYSTNSLLSNSTHDLKLFETCLVFLSQKMSCNK